MQYILRLLGQQFHLSVPFSLQICDNMAPFIHIAQGESSEYYIRVRTGAPVLPGAGSIWCGTYYYEYFDHFVRVLHCERPGSAPYAMVEFSDDGNVGVVYRKEFARLFKSASGLLHHIGMESLMLQHNSLILHAALVKYAGKGILFTAPSGTGKSTQARLWQTYQNAEIMNGDRAGLRKYDEQWIAWGLPYAGTSGIYRNESAPVSAIVVLRQGGVNRIEKLSGVAAIRYCYPELTVHQWDSHFVQQALDLLEDLLKKIPVFLLECVPDHSAVTFLADMLQEEGLL